MLSRVFLLPGAYHGSWCYKYVCNAIHKLKHEYILIDYPRRSYPDPPNSIQEYVDHTTNIVKYVSTIDPSLPLFIVGHSLGGLIASNVAETCYQHISGVILIAGAIPESAQYAETLDATEDVSSYLATKSTMNNNVDIMYNDCSHEQIDWVKSQLQSEYLYGDYIAKWTKRGFGSIPKLYIQTQKDEIITLSKQRKICNILGVSVENGDIIGMNTSHSPFLSQPAQLALNIDRFIRGVI